MSELTATTNRSHSSRESTDGARSPSLLAQHAGLIRIASIVAIIVGLFLIMRTLPVADGLAWLESWVEQAGAWGPIGFGGVYVILAVLFIPGGVLTLAAGAIFGLFWGFITVSLASTTAAAISFLIARYLARKTVRQQAEKYPRFKAVDRAIGEGGWKIVGMLRLVPIFPFSVGNYLLGLTPVKFWPYVLASWVGMMPGTLVYVYFGHVGRAGVEAAAGESRRDPLEWVLMGVGLVAILGITVYLTRKTQQKLAEQAELEPQKSEPEVAAARSQEQTDGTMTTRERTDASGTGKTIGLLVTAIALLVLGACATLQPNWLSNLFGPPAVVMVEAYERKPGGPTFDHSLFDEQLRTYVSDEDGGGWIDYAAWKANDRKALQEYIEQLGKADFSALGRNEKLALLINAYNAFTIELIFEYWDAPEDGHLKSIRDIPASKRWDHQRWRIGENVWSLNQIEHEQIRPKFKEPRIHWVVVCAAIGCPPLRREAYTGDRMEEQLHDQGVIVHTHERWFRYDRANGVVHLTKLYDWYADDYVQVDGGILEHAAQYVPELREDLEAGNRPRIRWIDYDWDLNHRSHVKGSGE